MYMCHVHDVVSDVHILVIQGSLLLYAVSFEFVNCIFKLVFLILRVQISST